MQMQQNARLFYTDLNLSLPRWAWNLLTLFFAGWLVTAGWVLLGNDDAAIVRFAFALCGILCLLTGSYGKLLSLPLFTNNIFQSLIKGLIIIGVLLSIIGSMIWLPLSNARDSARAMTALDTLAIDGAALLRYAQKHQGTLPADMHRQAISDYFLQEGFPYEPETRPGMPIRWCGALSGMKVADFPQPEKIVVAYSSEIYSGHERAVLLLDGQRTFFYEDRFIEIMRAQPSLIAEAKKTSIKHQSGKTGSVTRTTSNTLH